MNSFNRWYNLSSWLVFAIALTVYYFSVERTGSLWDVGEFILGAYRLQVVHPPGAPLFLMIGRLFTWLAELFSDDPSDIAFSVNLMSGICTAFTAFFVARITMLLGRLALQEGEAETTSGESLALAGAGLVAGLTTAFATSIWFSAVEGEVYAMSTFFTALTLWAVIKWYSLPASPQNDRWLLFAVYAAALSIGVHLLSLLTFPALALFYYYKRYEKHTFWGTVAAAAVGVGFIVGIQTLIIVGIPQLWASFELLMVNGMGLPFNSGLIPTLLLVAAIIVLILLYLHEKITSPVPLYVLAAVLAIVAFVGTGEDAGRIFKRLLLAGGVVAIAVFRDRLVANRHAVQLITLGAALAIIGFSTIGMVVIRANANPPINMNEPADAMRLLPYINREQYGERPLLRGPHFEAQPVSTEVSDRYGRVGDKYEIVDQKIDYVFDDADKMLFPRMSDYSQGRPQLYKQWMGLNPDAPLPPGRPNMGDNLSFLFRYQLGWMYWRYFMWNFAGRQNGEQGFEPWDKANGHWLSGIDFIDEMRLYNQDKLPEYMKMDQSRNKYYMLPFLFGLAGLFFHFRKRSNDAVGLLALFVITGIGIIIYSNQPPREPRERDYVLAGSIFTYAIWVGFGVLALFDLLRRRVKLSGPVAGAVASVLLLSAPLLMGVQNFDDHSRIHHTGARDYANNFLQSCAPNAIIFTYGDNDTYPLWYAQEVEGIRPDVRVVNLSLIAVDWYIDLLRRKINDSPPIKLSIPSEGYRGDKRNQVFYYNPSGRDQEMTLQSLIKFIGEYHPLQANSGREIESHIPSTNIYIPVDSAAVRRAGFTNLDSLNIPSRIPIKLPLRSQPPYIIKDELAILDLIASNIWERPIYFAVTVRPDKLFGLDDYLQLEGLALRLVPVRGASDPQYGVVGSGRVATDSVYHNVMTKFKWGNFDKYDMYVNDSYAPSIQSHQLAMRRAGLAMIQEGKREMAIELTNKYFEAFPHMNFPYDYRAFTMIQVYLAANAYDKAKPHLEILAEEIADRLEFYYSIDPQILDSSFRNEYGLALRTMDDLKRTARDQKDEEFLKRLEEMFAAYAVEPTENVMPTE